MNPQEIICDRCGAKIDGYRGEYATAGFYDVTGESWWSRYAKPGERNVCDACMLADENYCRDYGIPAPGQLHLTGEIPQ